MFESLILLALAVGLLVFLGVVGRFLAGLVLIVIALAVPVLLLIDLVNGGLVLETVVEGLAALFVALYAGLVSFSRRVSQ